MNDADLAISDVTMKTGSTGVLCFVSVEHTCTTRAASRPGAQDIVYRDMDGAAPSAPPKALRAARRKHRETHVSDPVLLFLAIRH
jgi:3-methylfumaryl-CoA hydratase